MPCWMSAEWGTSSDIVADIFRNRALRPSETVRSLRGSGRRPVALRLRVEGRTGTVPPPDKCLRRRRQYRPDDSLDLFARELQGIIATENAVLLKNVKGLGLKTAQKIIVELSGKMAGLGLTGDTVTAPVAGGDYEEALAALVMLGFGKAAADKVVKSLLGKIPELRWRIWSVCPLNDCSI